MIIRTLKNTKIYVETQRGKKLMNGDKQKQSTMSRKSTNDQNHNE